MSFDVSVEKTVVSGNRVLSVVRKVKLRSVIVQVVASTDVIVVLLVFPMMLVVGTMVVDSVSE